MNILGLKTSHDAGIAGVSGDKLIFAVEVEKFDNNNRHSVMGDPEIVGKVVKEVQFSSELISIDGWKKSFSKELQCPVAPYHDFDGGRVADFSGEQFLNGLKLFGQDLPYCSFPHSLGHILGAYMTSEFAVEKEPAYVLVWDGGQNARIHYIAPKTANPIRFIANAHNIYGTLYGIMGLYFGPYKNMKPAISRKGEKFGHMDWPGKLMARISFGRVHRSAVDHLHRIYAEYCYRTNQNVLGKDTVRAKLDHYLMEKMKIYCANYGICDDDALMCIHTFMQEVLLKGIEQHIPKGANLCFSGGSALNIKWNSAIRRSGLVGDLWVPPFPNDSGSALGTAFCAAAATGGVRRIEWDVYCGLYPVKRSIVARHPGWEHKRFSILELGQFFADNPRSPVVVINGKTELGPRALGNRSIMCNPSIPSNKTLLNTIKGREEFRPIAPICLESHAKEIFDPGTPDPYMLFDHVVRTEARNIVPAIMHIDNTARVQTVTRQQNSVIHVLLSEFYARTGIPLLCNTSANLNGSGFFPDVESAMRWGRVDHIWSDGYLYSKEKSQ